MGNLSSNKQGHVTWYKMYSWNSCIIICDIPGGGHGDPLQYSCLENPHEQRSLAGYSPWGRKELDVTEHAHTRADSTWKFEGQGAPRYRLASDYGVSATWIGFSS